MSGATLDPESELIKRETVGIFLEAVFRLGDKDAYVLRLFIEGFDESKIAEIFGTSEEAVKKRLYRTRHQIENFINKKGVGSGGGSILEEDRMGTL